MAKTKINKSLALPESYEYIGVFLTLRCNFNCSYCINNFESCGNGGREKRLSADDWIAGLNRLTGLEKPDGTVVPVTLQGGEPTLHPGFFDIINGLDESIPIDILTNLSAPAVVDKFIESLDPKRLRRDSPYASVRVSYHPNHQTVEVLIKKICLLQKAGFDVGLWGLDHPAFEKKNADCTALCKSYGIEFRLKEFLGYDGGKLYGTYKYPFSCELKDTEKVNCKTTELLINPSGDVYRCHHDLYGGFEPVGHILDGKYKIVDEYRFCNFYGHCNPCDVKLKTNRLQQFGHTSVEIRFLGN
jgi:hypothetical protein